MGAYSSTFSLTDDTTAYGSQVKTELDALGSSVNNIVNAQISSGAAIADSKLAKITTAGKVTGAAITSFTDIPDSKATASEVKTGTESAKYVAPSTMIGHEGIAKGWINFVGNGSAINDSFNVTGITDNGTGDFTITWDTDFGDGKYAVVGTAGGTDSPQNARLIIDESTTAQAAGVVRISITNTANARVDCGKVCVIAIGDR